MDATWHYSIYHLIVFAIIFFWMGSAVTLFVLRHLFRGIFNLNIFVEHIIDGKRKMDDDEYFG